MASAEDVLLTSDTHFWHGGKSGRDGILNLGAGRPWDTVEEMNDELIYNWNSVVHKAARVYHLGDFSFGSHEQTLDILGRLNGQIHLIRGNHDHNIDKLAKYFASYRDYHVLKVKGQKVVLFHFPVASWWGVGKGVPHAHGHCHANFNEANEGVPRYDVGVDNNNWTPIHFDEFMDKVRPFIGKWLPGDHHGSLQGEDL